MIGTTKRTFFWQFGVPVLKHKGIVGAGLNTGWSLGSSLTEVAFIGYPEAQFLVHAGGDRSLRTSHDTHPASNTAVLIYLDKPCFLIAPHGSYGTGFHTFSVFTDTTIGRKGERTSHLDFYFGIDLWLL
jgi:hypothetical protein